MLPLWIIDISCSEESNASRKVAFLHFLEKMEHVYIPDDLKSSCNKQAGQEKTSTNATISAQSEMVAPSEAVQLTPEEQIEEKDKRTAIQDAAIKGNYWYYSAFDNAFEGLNVNDRQLLTVTKNLDDKTSKGGLAQRLYDFQEAMVETGRKFITEIRKSNAKPYQTINVVVLGDATEEFSQLVFPSIAAILQKEKGRFLPTHIHQGLNILGALYIPCDVNTKKVLERGKVLRLLKELDVQHNLQSVRGYDHVMLYQNVQNRTECYYPILKDSALSAYLLQCLVHLFFACDINHPLISGTSSEDDFYFCMGATSVYFDMEDEDRQEAVHVVSELVKRLKEDAKEDCETREDFVFLDKSLYEASSLIKHISSVWSQVDTINLSSVADFDISMPHPVMNFAQKRLKRLYYEYTLKFFPATLMRRILEKIEAGTIKYLEKISTQCVKFYKNAELSIQPSIARVFSKVTYKEGAMAQLDKFFKGLQEDLSKQKSLIRGKIEMEFWERYISEKSIYIPKQQRDDFREYHAVYNNDISVKNDGAGCEKLRKEALLNLQDHISQEKTVLATLGRSFLLGILCVLVILPILSIVSPYFIDLGDVKGNPMIWGIVLFMLPLLIQIPTLWFYLRKRNRLVQVLCAYYTHDAYARIANRVEYEATEFYNKFIKLCEEYLERGKVIRRDVIVEEDYSVSHLPIPRTLFNQPLNGGKFNDDLIIPKNEIEGSLIKVQYRPIPVAELDDLQYYLLINHFNNEFASLYKGVCVLPDHMRRLDDATHEYIFVSKEQLLKERGEEWEKTKEVFHSAIIKGVRDEIVPREYPSVGEKIVQYRRKTDNADMLKPMIQLAASNGELTSEYDTEYADIKINKDIMELVGIDLPLYNTNQQESKHNELYKKYLFITRWRSFNQFSFNRILPDEDFDVAIHEKMVYEAELEANEQRAHQRKIDEAKALGIELEEQFAKEKKESEYVIIPSALILWSVCADNTSNEWMKIVGASHFSDALEDRAKIRQIMNQDD